MNPIYLGKYGQLSSLNNEFLKGSDINAVLGLQNSEDIINYLSSRYYKEEVDKFYGEFKTSSELTGIILNAHMVNRVNKALMYLPYDAKMFISAYLGKFDIENIKVILSSKVLKYDISQTDQFLMINKNPIGYTTNVLSADDYKSLLEQPDVEGVINTLIKNDYGRILLQYVDEYKMSGNLSDMFNSLDKYYYVNLIEQLKVYGGAESKIGEFVRDLIDMENILLLAKSTIIKLDIENLIIDGGNIPSSELLNIKLNDIDDIKAIKWEGLDKAVDEYKKDKSLSNMGMMMKNTLYNNYMLRFKTSSAGIGFILYYILKAEIERDNLRLAILSKGYGMSPDFIKKNLISV